MCMCVCLCVFVCVFVCVVCAYIHVYTFIILRLDNLSCMVERIKTMRMELYKALKAKGTPGSWEHIIKQIGMFTFTGLTRTLLFH